MAQRIEAQEDREQAESAREAATSERESNRPPLREIHRPSGPPATLRRQVTRIALKLAEMEDKIARTHADMATQWPDKAAGYERTAEKARGGARQAREIARRFGN